MTEGYTSKLRRLFPVKLFKYGIIGGISTMIHVGVASAYIYMVNSSLLQSNIVGFMVAYLFSYTMQSIFVFEHAISWHKALRYFIVQFGSLLASIAISNMFYLFNSYVKTVLVVVLMPLVTFMVHKFWTFKDKESKAL